MHASGVAVWIPPPAHAGEQMADEHARTIAIGRAWLLLGRGGERPRCRRQHLAVQRLALVRDLHGSAANLALGFLRLSRLRCALAILPLSSSVTVCATSSGSSPGLVEVGG